MNVTLPIDDIVGVVRGAKVGLLTNGTFWLEQVGDDLTGVVRRACRELVVLYGERGPRGHEGAGTPSGQTHDPYLGCETRSLYVYGPELYVRTVADLDLLIIGMPDIGCRHYSYKRTMCYLMEVAAQLGLPVVVVDFPIPVGGHVVEGNLPDPDYYRKQRDEIKTYLWFAAPLTYRYGMTMGELALMAKDHLNLDLDLRVIKLQGWRRDMWWQDTGWPYVPLDPSIYTADTTIGFLCTGLFQGTNMSWGIGAARPFHVIGAPWIEDDRLLRALRKHDLPGVTWTRAHFVPRWTGEDKLWGRYAGELCNGVRLHVTDRDALRTAQVQLTLLVELFRLYPDKFGFVSYDFAEDLSGMDCRLEDEQWARRLKAGEGVDTILAEWEDMSRQFGEIRKDYLLY